MKQFSSILVANRAEIAVRVIRSAKEQGYRTIAVYSEADVDSPHVAMADEAVLIGGAPAKDSYLNVEKILAAAKKPGRKRFIRVMGFCRKTLNLLTHVSAWVWFLSGQPLTLLRSWVTKPRHVEVQVFGDHHGNVIHLGERDCSVQRRHQKVVEEAPCPIMTPDLREAMGKAAVDAAKSVQYVGAGTVEFLLDAKGEFYFLEMNTRLQVEHPVTEMITGQDLVALQFYIAHGHRLPLEQKDVRFTGHAIEVRLYAEDTTNDFLPATGTALLWQPLAVMEAMKMEHQLVAGISGEVDCVLAVKGDQIAAGSIFIKILESDVA
jgi:acetyl/propionyl-CoA carboxylase alpha subunit